MKNFIQKLLDFILKVSDKILPKKIANAFHKVLTLEVFFYILFGVLTTIVNIGSFAILTSCFDIKENVANIISIVLAVLFAYFTNRSLVFHSTASSFKEKLFEFFKFILGRAFTMIIEFLGFFLMFNIIGIHRIISKTIITIVVIILNFFISKLFAFKSSKITNRRFNY